jgi:uncharacterized protein YfaQ (DUF2300 family)
LDILVLLDPLAQPAQLAQRDQPDQLARLARLDQLARLDLLEYKEQLAQLDHKEQLDQLVILIKLVLIGRVEQVLLIISGNRLLTVMDYGLLFLILVQEIG